MGVSALFLSTGLVAFLIAGYRGVLCGRGRRKPTETPLIVIAIALGLAFVFLAPATQALESALAPSLGRLLSNVCTLVAAFGCLHLMVYVSHPPDQVPAKVWIRLITLLIAIGVMAVMFFASSPPTGTGIFTGLYRSQPTLAVYVFVYASYLGSAVVDLAVLALCSVRGGRAGVAAAGHDPDCRRVCVGRRLSDRESDRRRQRARHRLHRRALLPVGVRHRRLRFRRRDARSGRAAHRPWYNPAHARPAAGTSHSRLLALALSPAAATVMGDLARALWETLHEALPDIALATPGHPPSSSPPGETSERLYRRVIAIRDGLLALQPYRDPADTREHRDQADAAGLTDRRRAAAIEAADIRAALHRRQHDMPPRGYSAEGNAATHHDDLTSELRWLTQVSDALAHDELRQSPS